MRNEEFYVPRHDGGIVRAILTRGDSTDCVVYLPCFEGNHRDALPHMAAQYFAQCGISFVRIDPFFPLEGGRNMSDEGVTITDHVHDLHSVIAFIRQQYGINGAIHGVAHSLSAYPMIMAGADMSAGLSSIVLWDGSDPSGIDLETTYRVMPFAGYQVSFGGYGFIMASSYLESIRHFQLPNPASWRVPLLVVVAGAGPLVEASKGYVRQLQPSHRYVVEGADHHFIADPDCTAELLSVTSGWVSGGFRGLLG